MSHRTGAMRRAAKRFAYRQRHQERCIYCLNEFDSDERQRTVDHVVPLSLVGTRRKNNFVLCCRSCNLRKGNMTIEEFLPILFSTIRSNK